jgi:hypothetical protein
MAKSTTGITCWQTAFIPPGAALCKAFINPTMRKENILPQGKRHAAKMSSGVLESCKQGFL